MPPVAVNLTAGVSLAALSGRTTCAWLETRELYCWGDGSLGQLGLGTTGVGAVPTSPVPLGGAEATSVYSGGDYTCILSTVGSVLCWGSNSYGQLGLGLPTNNNIGDAPGEMPPAAVAVGGVVAQLSCGETHVCVTLVTGEVQCWGRGGLGELGVNLTTNIGDGPGEMPPLSVPLTTPVATLHLRGDTSCVVFFNGLPSCWGLNTDGQLGIGNTVNQLLPPSSSINLPTSRVHSLAPGINFVCALLTDGQVQCWGKNSWGQLGIGSAVSQLVPVATILAPILFSVSPMLVYAPMTTLTLYGAGFGSLSSNVAVYVGSVLCPITLFTPFHIECTPPWTTTGYFKVNVTRTGFGTSNAINSIRILPYEPIVSAVSPTSGLPGITLTISVLSVDNVGQTVVSFLPHEDHNLCVSNACDGTVLSVDFAAQVVTVQVPPALPPATLYDIVVQNARTTSQAPFATFLACTDDCDRCRALDDPVTAVQCTQCRESLGFYLDVSGTLCINSSCNAGEILSTRTGALRCSCDQSAGQFLSSDAQGCVDSCLPREFLDVSGPNHQCIPCDSSCLACAAASASSCTACPSGVILELQGSSGAQCVGSCTLCGTGLATDPISGRCFCPAGTFYDSVKRSCLPCPGNSYSNSSRDPDLPSSQTCTSCPVHTEMDLGASHTSLDECLCRPGFVLNPSASDGSCACAAGFFYDATSLSCSACLPDSYTSTPGTPATCRQCSAIGAYRTTNGQLAQSSAAACVCPDTMIPDPAGTGCVCPAGTFFEETSSQCRVCEVDSYRNTTTLSATCVLCSTVGALRTNRYTSSRNSSTDCACPPTLVEHPTTRECVCEPGYFLDLTSTTCRICPMDTYSDKYSDEVVCTSCQTLGSYRTTNLLQGRTARASCVCEPGYYPNKDNTYCISCNKIADVSCNGGVDPTLLASPENLTLVGASGVVVPSGYWLTTEAVYLPAKKADETPWFVLAKCPLAVACPGGTEAETCAVGYTGPACGLCEQGYGRLGVLCAKCVGQAGSQMLMALMVVILVAVCAVVLFLSARSHAQSTHEPVPVDKESAKLAKEVEHHSQQTSLGMKIAITHLQILGFTGNFGADWPDALFRVIAIPASAAKLTAVASNNLALDCLVQPSLQSRAITIFVLPLIIIAGVSLGYTIIGLATRNFTHIGSKIMQGTLLLLYVAHPGIVESLLKVMVCVPVGKKSFAESDMTVDCSSASFIALRTIAALYIVFYGIGGLVLVVVLAKKYPKAFAFLIKGYRTQTYYWDVVTIFRSLLFVVVSLFAPPALQLYFGNWILLIGWLVLHYSHPYKEQRLHAMETSSLWILLLTVTTGSLFFTGVVDPKAPAGVLLAVILILLNLAAVFVFVSVTATHTVVAFVETRRKSQQLRKSQIISPSTVVAATSISLASPVSPSEIEMDQFPPRPKEKESESVAQQQEPQP
eukprot:TRINITY_DN439_c0_g1_i1.p1 TRINITY_DN439_c0_g1~~TRINITY_DN439_c0_g1_i1.p1  ORF type:complete len:1650 (-),score=343.71 TRINITY_DN439_c0_g1_i1:64-4377(-)